MSDHQAPESTRDTPTRKMLAELQGEELVKWRIADFPDRMSADARNMPREFPMGWYAVSYSDELAVGEVKAVRVFG
jgi:hypothetical protein